MLDAAGLLHPPLKSLFNTVLPFLTISSVTEEKGKTLSINNFAFPVMFLLTPNYCFFTSLQF